MQRDWFEMSSNKLTTVLQLESLLTAVRDVSQSLMEHFVNMADTNVCSCHCHHLYTVTQCHVDHSSSSTLCLKKGPNFETV